MKVARMSSTTVATAHSPRDTLPRTMAPVVQWHCRGSASPPPLFRRSVFLQSAHCRLLAGARQLRADVLWCTCTPTLLDGVATSTSGCAVNGSCCSSGAQTVAHHPSLCPSNSGPAADFACAVLPVAQFSFDRKALRWWLRPLLLPPRSASRPLLRRPRPTSRIATRSLSCDNSFVVLVSYVATVPALIFVSRPLFFTVCSGIISCCPHPPCCGRDFQPPCCHLPFVSRSHGLDTIRRSTTFP